MTFKKVLQAMKEGKKVKRKAWDFNYEGYCTNQDLLADDWEIVGEEQPKPKNYLSEANDRIRKLQELQKSVEQEREYQLTHWNGSDLREKYIRNLGSIMNDIQWEIHSMRVKAEIDGCVMLNADGTPYTGGNTDEK